MSEEITPGSILINNIDGKFYGVLVTKLPNNKVIVFRLDKNTHPIFSKLNNHPQIIKSGIINEHQHAPLKSALLKHYRTYNLTSSEKNMLQPLMDFAFPLGIPEYQPDVELPERDLKLMDLHSKLNIGSRLYLNTTPKSCYQHLNNKTVKIVNKTPEGIWVNLPTNETDVNNINNSLYYLFFKNPEIPTFSGISRILPLQLSDETEEKVNPIILDSFNELNNTSSLTTTMEFNGDKLKVLPTSRRVIFPEVYKNMLYTPNLDTFTVEPDDLTTSLADKLKNNLHVSNDTNTNSLWHDNEVIFSNKPILEEKKLNSHINKDGEIEYEKIEETMAGGSKSSIPKTYLQERDLEESKEWYNDNSLETHNIDDIEITSDTLGQELFKDDELEYLINHVKIKKTLKESNSDNEDDIVNDKLDDITSNTESDLDEEDFEIANDSEIEELGTYQKVKLVEITEDVEKTYKESIQRGDIFKYKINQIPTLRRTDPTVINKINKEINIISLLKNVLTREGRHLYFTPQDFKPLINTYVKGDFNNNFLIPLVINKKKIYLDRNKKLNKDEFDSKTHNVIENFYDELGNLLYQIDGKGSHVNNDVYVSNIISSMNPNITEDSEIGLMFRLGDGYDTQDYKKYNTNFTTIRYCDKPMKCQTVALNTMNFDYQVNLGPLARFLDPNDDINTNVDEDIEGNRHDINILYNQSKYKINYPGDLVNIIGFVRPPITYFNDHHNLLFNTYQTQANNNKVITVNLEDINPEILDEELNDQIDINKNPDSFIIYLLPQSLINNETLSTELQKIIPDIDNIIQLYIPQKNIKITGNGLDHPISLTHTMDYIYKILEKFDYDTTNLPLSIHNKIIEENNKLLESYDEFNKKINNDFENYIKKLENDKKEVRKDKYHKLHNSESFKYITDNLFEELSKFYFQTYENQGISNEKDSTRLQWFLKSVDNGKYFYKTQFMNYLKMYRESHNLDQLEGQLTVLREKHNMIKVSLDAKGIKNNKCSGESFNKGPNIIKYPNIPRLEQDNGKVAMDSDGTVIIPGDYALVDVQNPTGKGLTKQLYKRDIVSDQEMWIKENIEALHKIIHDKKEQCKNKDMDISSKENICTFNTESLQCESLDIFKPTKEINNIEHQLVDLQSQVDYLKNIPVLVANLEKELQNDRSYLLNKLNSDKRYWKEMEEKEKKLEETIVKNLIKRKQCIHTNVTDYFYKISGYDENRYRIAQAILKRFENFDDEFENDINTIDKDNDKNYTYCNVCNQQLICNHFKYGVKMLEENDAINFDMVINKYSDVIDGSYVCKVCGEFIGNTEVKDLEEFAGGEDGGIMKTRELIETTSIIDQKKLYLDGVINELLNPKNTENIEKNEDLDIKIKIFRLLKQLSGLDILTINDEIDMINFIKSYNFVTRELIIKQILKQQSISAISTATLSRVVNKEFKIYYACDIASRYLITLQSAHVEYELHNKDCSVNIIGYPLINDIELKGGIDFILCLLSQIAILPDYSFLANLDSNKFINRLKKQVDEDLFVKTKLLNAVNNKSDVIDHMSQFIDYYTNNWNTYLPRLKPIEITWTPEKILNDSNLDEVTFKNLNRMIEVGYENQIHTCLQIIKNINNIINISDRTNPIGDIQLNSCCKENYDGTNNNPYVYMNYFNERNSKIKDLIKDYYKTDKLIKKLQNIKLISTNNFVYEPIYKPSQKILYFNLNADPSEIRELYLKYIDKGINKGKLHIYDRYGRCILSNERKIEIADKTYTQNDYERLQSAIVSGNAIDVKSYLQRETEELIDLDIIEQDIIQTIYNSIPDLNIMSFLKEYFKKIIESFPIIYGKNIVKQKDDKFDINRHLANLYKQIDIEKNDLIPKLSASDKQTTKYDNIINNMGNFKKLYEEYKTSNSIFDSTTYRYNKKEDHIQYTIKYLNDVINQIKNGKLTINIEDIRPQYRDFIAFGSNGGLFKLLSIHCVKPLYDFIIQIKSKIDFKVLYPEFVATILHYLNVLSLTGLFNVLDNKKISNKKAEIIKYTFKPVESTPVDIEPINMGDEIVMEMTDDLAGAMEEKQMDFIEKIEEKSSDNIKVVTSFVITYLNKIDQMLQVYDALTKENITKNIAKHDQKQIEATLKSVEYISKEGHEEEYKLLRIKMNILKKVEYRNLSEYAKTIFGDEFLETDEGQGVHINEEQFGEDGEVINRGVNEYGIEDYEMGEMGGVFEVEDYEGDGQGYEFMGVGEED